MKRRILAALAAFAVGATVLFGTSSAAVAAPPGGSPYVAIGDSNAAGTGNKPYVDEACNRSKKAYPMVVSSSLGLPVVSVACAGDDTDDVAAHAAALAATGELGPATQLVTITAGVNNVQWQTLLALCSGAGTPAQCDAAQSAAAAAIQTIGPALFQLVAQVRQLAVNAVIVVTGYPLLFGMGADGCTIGGSRGGPVTISPELMADVNTGVMGINAAVSGGVEAYKAFASDPKVEFVDVVPAFFGHGLCDTGERWIHGVSAGAPTADRGFHPTVAGQQMYAALVAGAYLN